MATVIVGLVSDVHQARGVIRALDDAGFSGDDIDMSGALLSELAARGVPDEEAGVYAEGVRRGGAIVCVRTEDDEEAAEAAELMAEHGVVDVDACAAGWTQPVVGVERYAVAFGEYPNAPGRIYHDPRADHDQRERRVRQRPYDGMDRRVI
jgi:hypothetical protein